MKKFDFKKGLEKAKQSLSKVGQKLSSLKEKAKSKGSDSNGPSRFVKLKSKVGQLKQQLGSQGFRFEKLKSFRINKKHIDRVLELRVERVPPLSQIFPLTKKLKFPLFFLFGLLCADLIIRSTSFFFLGSDDDKRARAPKVTVQPKRFLRAQSTYDEIVSKNIFCPGCPVPDMKTIAINRPKDCSKAKPLRSSANLVGTIVLSNANYSVATLIDGSITYALKRGEEFKNYGKVFEIRRTRVCFENQDGLLFYLKLPDVEEVTPKVATTSASTGRQQLSEGIYQTGENDLEIDKSFIVKALGNPNILYEAYATEYKVDGEIQGFRIHSINPGSTIEKLGFKPGDIITEVDGKPMDSVARAQELYNSAATTSDMSITILRDGNRITKSFTVK